MFVAECTLRLSRRNEDKDGISTMKRADIHYANIPPSWDAVKFTTMLLSATPRWLHILMYLRDRVVSTVGFAPQPEPNPPNLSVQVGSAAGPFTFYEVSPEAVIGGNNDKHISYTVRFVVESSPSSTHGGVETQARSYSTLGSAYLAAIWPFHKLVVHRLLRNVQF